MADTRSSARAKGKLFRMSEEDRARLQREAHAAGMTVQELFEVRMLGYSKPLPVQPNGSRPRRQTEELPLTG